MNPKVHGGTPKPRAKAVPVGRGERLNVDSSDRGSGTLARSYTLLTRLLVLALIMIPSPGVFAIVMLSKVLKVPTPVPDAASLTFGHLCCPNINCAPFNVTLVPMNCPQREANLPLRIYELPISSLHRKAPLRVCRPACFAKACCVTAPADNDGPQFAAFVGLYRF